MNLIAACAFCVVGIRFLRFAWWLTFKTEEHAPYLRRSHSMVFNRRKNRFELR